MKDTFKAYELTAQDDKATGAFKTMTIDDLPEGDVLIDVHYSSINFKDALATNPRSKVIKDYPIIPGIDAAGVVAQSDHPSFEEGDEVVVTGYELGVSHDGGFSEYVRVPGDWAVKVPKDLTLEEAMVFGTAGFTAALSIQRLEDSGIAVDKGPVLVRGTSGGVGSLALMMLSELGYKVTASTSHDELKDDMKKFGAKDVISRITSDSSKPLEKGVWQGVIDPVGGETLGEVIKTVKPNGGIALSGNASGAIFESTVLPFILRGIKLLGIDSVYCDMKMRERLWRRLATDLKPEFLHDIKTVVPFEELESGLEKLKDHKVYGRMVVKMPNKS
ncbi:acryloyl-CoA reductase [Staphylococcus massiliensis]|uniref:Alcohol dehydrogenase n=1 Tax=Staphylococcus massiliensis S46 TaxID=1229783 RepID=K9AP20_9STAP|nr:acryloyl-CoA reductase [Staphylococcus massiliensis]EKU49069.1 alcohol dehydrogenase [Staphylococcus massiliensis S46]